MSVDPILWSIENAFGPAGGPRRHVLTQAGRVRAMRVVAGVNEKAAAALLVLGECGSVVLDSCRDGKLFPSADSGLLDGFSLGVLSVLGYTRTSVDGMRRRVVALTERGAQVFVLGQREAERLLDRVRKEHPL